MTIVSGASASLLWDQVSVSADGYYSDGISTNGSQFFQQTVADDFTLSMDSNITSFVFWGSSENLTTPDLSNFASWDVQLMDSSFNTLASGNFTAAQLNATATGVQNLNGGDEYRFEVGFNGVLTAGTYWFNIGTVNVSSQDDGFAWSTGGGVADTTSAGNLSDGVNGWSGWGTFDNSGGSGSPQGQAFQVYGDAVPEPASMALLGLGAAALLRRRRKN